MKTVFVTVNAEGQIVITPAGKPGGSTAVEAPRHQVSLESPRDPAALDSKGRLTLPATIRRFLGEDDASD